MEKNEYRLIIDINGDMSGGSGVAESKDTTTDAKKGISLLTAYNMAQPFISATRQIIQNDVETRTGSGELSARIGLQMSIAEMGAKTLVGIASGKSLATMLGFSSPVGAIAGAVIAVGSTIANLAVKQNALNNQAKLENEQLQILRGRAGIQFNRSRMGE